MAVARSSDVLPSLFVVPRSSVAWNSEVLPDSRPARRAPPRPEDGDHLAARRYRGSATTRHCRLYRWPTEVILHRLPSSHTTARVATGSQRVRQDNRAQVGSQFRPVVVVTRDEALDIRVKVTVAEISTKARGLLVEVPVDPVCGVGFR